MAHSAELKRGGGPMVFWAYSIVVVPVLICLILGPIFLLGSDDLEVDGFARIVVLAGWPLLSALGAFLIVRVAHAGAQQGFWNNLVLAFFLSLTLSAFYAPFIGLMFLALFPGSDAGGGID